MEPRLISRFEWGITLPLQKLTPTELKEVVLHRCNIHKISLSPNAIDHLEQTFKRNTQSLYLAIDALALRIQLERKTGRGFKSNSFDVEQVNHYLRDLIEQETRDAIDAQRLIKIIADIYGIKTTDILGKSHIQVFSQARQMAMHFCRKFLELPYTEIGRTFSRDHSTVISSVKAVESKIALQDKDIANIISEIQRRLESN
jgi:chromosomal replication initiator protein